MERRRRKPLAGLPLRAAIVFFSCLATTARAGLSMFSDDGDMGISMDGFGMQMYGRDREQQAHPGYLQQQQQPRPGNLQHQQQQQQQQQPIFAYDQDLEREPYGQAFDPGFYGPDDDLFSQDDQYSPDDDNLYSSDEDRESDELYFPKNPYEVMNPYDDPYSPSDPYAQNQSPYDNDDMMGPMGAPMDSYGGPYGSYHKNLPGMMIDDDDGIDDYMDDYEGDQEDADMFPPVACPGIFKYMYDPKYGGYFGYISIPRPSGQIKYDAEINMTINRPVSQQDNIKLQLMSTANDIYYGDTLNWAVRFPYQDLMPKLTQVKFNGLIICSNYPDPLIPGVTQSSMWAKSSISSGKRNKKRGKKDRRKKKKKKPKQKKRKIRKRRKLPVSTPPAGLPHRPARQGHLPGVPMDIEAPPPPRPDDREPGTPFAPPPGKSFRFRG